MGSEFVSPEEAAKRLKVSRRTVHDYLQKGALRRVRLGKHNRIGIPVEDVDALVVDLGVNFPPLNKKTFFRLIAQVERLERDILVLKRMNAVVDSPLRPTPQEAIGLHNAATVAGKSASWEMKEIVLWADLFDRMDEVFFDALEAQNLIEPWKPFYDLCIGLMRQVSTTPSFEQNIDLQHLHKRLAEGMKLLRRVIVAWIEMGHGRTADDTLSKLDADAAILRRLGAKDVLQVG